MTLFNRDFSLLNTRKSFERKLIWKTLNELMMIVCILRLRVWICYSIYYATIIYRKRRYDVLVDEWTMF
jgi:hypothetical protein